MHITKKRSDLYWESQCKVVKFLQKFLEEKKKQEIYMGLNEINLKTQTLLFYGSRNLQGITINPFPMDEEALNTTLYK